MVMLFVEEDEYLYRNKDEYSLLNKKNNDVNICQCVEIVCSIKSIGKRKAFVVNCSSFVDFGLS